LLGWIIAIVIVLLVLILPVGVSAAYDDNGFLLHLKLGVLKIRLLPRREKSRPKRKRRAKEPAQPKEKQKKEKQRLRLRDIRELLRIVLRALHRLRVHLSVDVLRLYITVAGDDPYDTVRLYGAVNAGLGIMLAELHKVLKIRDEDVAADLDLEAQQLQITAKITATLQIWEILLIGVCTAAALLAWHIRRKKQDKAARECTSGKEQE